MNKGKGWYGNRQAHSLASKGIKTTLNPSMVRFKGGEFYEADGVIYMPREDFVNRVDGQLRCLKAYGNNKWKAHAEVIDGTEIDEDNEVFYGGYVPEKEDNQETQSDNQEIVIPEEIEKPERPPTTADVPPPPTEEQVFPTPSAENDSTWDAKEKLEEAKDEEAYIKDQSKHASKMLKIAEKKEEALEKGVEKDAKQKMREEQVKAGVGVGGTKDYLTKAGKSIWDGVKKFFTASTKNIANSKPIGGIGSPLGDIKGSRSADTGKPKSQADYNNVTKETYKSVDADSMIATVENKEKLIVFANDLEHDIDNLDVLHRKHHNEFRTEERKDAKLFMVDYRKARSEMRDEIDLMKTTGQKESSIKSDIDNMKVVFEFNMNKLKGALKTQKMQHRADLKHIDDLKDDLGKLHKQTDKRIQQMVASGVRK